MTNITLHKPKINWLITEYDPKYCQWLIDYAYTNLNIIGFYGEHKISLTAAEEWEAQHNEWAEAIKMAEYRIQAGLNKHYNTLLTYAYGTPPKLDKYGRPSSNGRPPDFDMIQKIVFKLSDITLRIEKDTGNLKRRGFEDSKKKKVQDSALDMTVSAQIAEDLL